MARPRGFLEIHRSKAAARAIDERIADAREFDLPIAEDALREQAARCMDCGIPFCHQGCPLGNLVPDWNDLVSAGRFAEASTALHATNNFPEFTGRVCPAPCEAACVLAYEAIPGDATRREAPGAVTIKQIEREIADRALSDRGPRPRRATIRTGRRVAVVGSGPAGLACAQQLARRGHDVTVFEKDDRPGGLLRYGIPDFKLEKALLDRRIEQLRGEGVAFRNGVHVGVDVTGDELRSRFHAVVLAGGAMVPRDLPEGTPGRSLRGVHFAMEFLVQNNRRVAGDVIDAVAAVTATGRHVVVLGGGDTGSDCVGTSHRHGAASVASLELLPRPPDARHEDNPWPEWPQIYRTSSSHEEGGTREFGVMTRALVGDADGRVRALRVERVDGGGALEIPCDLVLLAMGFVGSPRDGLLEQLGLQTDLRGNVKTDGDGATAVPGVFAAGDVARGASLVVWAIAEGRRAASRVDAFLTADGPGA